MLCLIIASTFATVSSLTPCKNNPSLGTTDFSTPPHETKYPLFLSSNANSKHPHMLGTISGEKSPLQFIYLPPSPPGHFACHHTARLKTLRSGTGHGAACSRQIRTSRRKSSPRHAQADGHQRSQGLMGTGHEMFERHKTAPVSSAQPLRSSSLGNRRDR